MWQDAREAILQYYQTHMYACKQKHIIVIKHAMTETVTVVSSSNLGAGVSKYLSWTIQNIQAEALETNF